MQFLLKNKKKRVGGWVLFLLRLILVLLSICSVLREKDNDS